MYIKFAWIYLLNAKLETKTTFINFERHIENSLDVKIKELQCDMGGKYKALELLLKEEGTKPKEPK